MNSVPDIEDTVDEAVNNVVRRDKVTFGCVISRRSSKSSSASSTDSWPVKSESDSFIQGSYMIYIKTWGCSHNNSDSEYMAGQLDAAGYRITDEKNEADLWLLNSCTVKIPSERHLRNYVDEALSDGKFVVVAGCVSQAAPSMDWLKELSFVGLQQIDRVVEVVEETLKGNSVRLISAEKSKHQQGSLLTLSKIRRNPLIEILAINTGCLNHCTYCKTKQARGDLSSYSINDLLHRAKQSFTEGVKEIWLTSEDLGAYGRDLNVTLSELLRKMVKVIPDGCMLRLGMANPPYILDYLEDIADILNHPKVYCFLHIPVQSGSDAVLSDMKREYNCASFRRVVDYMLQNVPDVTIATDVICGFPTETPEDFNETMQLVADYKFPSLFINQFYPRPGTQAAKLPRIDTAEIKRRTKAIEDLFRSYESYSDRIESVYKVLITEESFDGKYYVGHNKSYEQVKQFTRFELFPAKTILLPKSRNLMGKTVDVRIVGYTKYTMFGETLNDEKAENVLKTGYTFEILKFAFENLDWLIIAAGFFLVILVIFS